MASDPLHYAAIYAEYDQFCAGVALQAAARAELEHRLATELDAEVALRREVETLIARLGARYGEICAEHPHDPAQRLYRLRGAYRGSLAALWAVQAEFAASARAAAELEAEHQAGHRAKTAKYAEMAAAMGETLGRQLAMIRGRFGLFAPFRGGRARALKAEIRAELSGMLDRYREIRETGEGKTAKLRAKLAAKRATVAELRAERTKWRGLLAKWTGRAPPPAPPRGKRKRVQAPPGGEPGDSPQI